jgi:hypothetical protein
MILQSWGEFMELFGLTRGPKTVEICPILFVGKKNFCSYLHSGCRLRS